MPSHCMENEIIFGGESWAWFCLRGIRFIILTSVSFPGKTVGEGMTRPLSRLLQSHVLHLKLKLNMIVHHVAQAVWR